MTPLKKFLFRGSVVFVIQLMIKGFDQTFGGFFDFTVRGFVLTGFIVPFWMAVWYTAEYINRKSSGIQQVFITLIHLFFGFSCSFLTNLAYRTGDIFFFNNEAIWEKNSILNPEFTLSLTLFYIMIWGFGQYHQSDLKLKQEQIKTERLMKENSLAQFMSLKAQIEPHFLFNSLSVLNSLIFKDTRLASEFVLKLSKSLRYVIHQNEFQLVSLIDEITFVRDYFFLLKTRFLESIEMNIQIEKKIAEKYFVPPASMQILVENAVKHNKFSSDVPLKIDIEIKNRYIQVRNNLSKRTDSVESNHKGLSNLKKRYELLTNQSVSVNQDDFYFTIRIPIIEKAHEDFNS